MKYLACLLTLLLIGCSGSTKHLKSDQEKAEYYQPVEFFDGNRNRSVYAGEVSHILQGSVAGTIVMKNGRTYSFESLGYRIQPSRADQEYNSRQQYMHQIEAYARQHNPE